MTTFIGMDVHRAITYNALNSDSAHGAALAWQSSTPSRRPRPRWHHPSRRSRHPARAAQPNTETGEVFNRRIIGRPHEVMDLRAPVRAVHEAGPTGYGLARRSRAAGIDVRVCAPGMIARSATEQARAAAPAGHTDRRRLTLSVVPRRLVVGTPQGRLGRQRPGDAGPRRRGRDRAARPPRAVGARGVQPR